MSLRLLAAAIALTVGPAAYAQTVVYVALDPPVIVPKSTTTLLVQVLVSGSPTKVTFESALQPGVELPMNDNGTGGDRVAGDGIYTVAIAAAPIVATMTPDDVYRPLLGYVRPYNGAAAAARYNLIAEVADLQIPRLPVTVDASDMQHTDYVVNIVAPKALPSSSAPSAIPDQSIVTKRFFASFPDNFDIVNVVYLPSFFQNRFHYSVRNQVQGIGSQLLDRGSTYGSAARLLGISVFPLSTYFDGAETGVQHEFGHQFINFLNVAPVASGIPHWPLSSMASGIMGFSLPGAEGGSFPCLLQSDPNGIRLIPNPNQPVFGDFDLYLMGLLPASQASEQFVLGNQDSNSVISACTGAVYTGAYTPLRLSDLTGNSAIGPRVPDASTSQKQFRFATIVVTPDTLLSPDAMAFYSLFAQRMELQSTALTHVGLAKATGIPFAISARGLGTMSARVTGPTTPQIAKLVNGATFQTPLAPGAWLTIEGTNLAATIRPWNGADFVNGATPTHLDGVSVTIGGHPAAVSYVNPNQVNILAPPEVTLGASVPLVVSTPQGSATANVNIQAIAPGFFAAGQYAVAQHGNYSLVGKAGLYPGSTPAKSGETILLYGTGFGPAAPPPSALQSVSQPAPMVTTPSFQIGGKPAQVAFAGLISLGLYQFNVTVPAGLPNGDALIVATDTGNPTQGGLYLTIQN
jgi:uncharacterized protein (TIGR03437 family)